MCTVTFWPCTDGYLLAMNRDELHTRPPGLPPALQRRDRCHVFHPGEPSGGTWIALNDRGVTLALVNWYSIEPRPVPSPISRGQVIATHCAAFSSEEVDTGLNSRSARLDLRRVLPFRLIGIFPDAGQIREWRWDQRSLLTLEHPWQPLQWASSGHDEPGAQRVRAAVFDEWCVSPAAGSLPWIRALHASHQPDMGPYSVCMHRYNARTVSYTETELKGCRAVMRHKAGSPCEDLPMSSDEFLITQGAA